MNIHIISWILLIICFYINVYTLFVINRRIDRIVDYLNDILSKWNWFEIK